MTYNAMNLVRMFLWLGSMNFLLHDVTLSAQVSPPEAVAAAEVPKTMPAAAGLEASSWRGELALDCSHSFNANKGSTQDCVTLRKAVLGIAKPLSERVNFELALSPFYQPSREARMLSSQQFAALDPDAGLFLYDFRLAWLARPNLTFALEQTEGAVVFPSMSGLSMANALSATPWDQTAMTISYNLPVLGDSRVAFFLGNGEGENLRNEDVQQYFGVRLQVAPAKAVQAEFGMSLDGNSYGSAATRDVQKRHVDCLSLPFGTGENSGGYETQRLGFALTLDGTHPAARGLQAALGFHRISQGDLHKVKQMSLPAAGCQRLNPDQYFLEDETLERVNTMTRQIFGFSGSYRILDRYWIGLEYQLRTIKSENLSGIDLCGGYVAGACVDRKSGHTIEESLLNTGLGLQLDDHLQLVLDYAVMDFKAKYRQFYYLNDKNEPSVSLEMVNLRVSASL